MTELEADAETMQGLRTGLNPSIVPRPRLTISHPMKPIPDDDATPFRKGNPMNTMQDGTYEPPPHAD